MKVFSFIFLPNKNPAMMIIRNPNPFEIILSEDIKKLNVYKNPMMIDTNNASKMMVNRVNKIDWIFFFIVTSVYFMKERREYDGVYEFNF